jgi:hypothetical protein
MKNIIIFLFASASLVTAIIAQGSLSDFVSFELEKMRSDSNLNISNISSNRMPQASTSQECLVIVKDVSGRENYAMILISSEIGQRVFAKDPSKRLAQGFYKITGSSCNQNLIDKQLMIYETLPYEIVKMHSETFENPDALMFAQFGQANNI